MATARDTEKEKEAHTLVLWLALCCVALVVVVVGGGGGGKKGGGEGDLFDQNMGS